MPSITINHAYRPILIGHFHEGIGQQLSEFFFLPSCLNLLNQYATSTFPIMHLISPPKEFCVSIAFSRFFPPVSTFPESFASVQPVLIITVF